MKDLKLIAFMVCGMILVILLANLWMTQGPQQVVAIFKPEVLKQAPALPPDYEPKVDPETGLAIYDPADPRWKWWREMREKDRSFEWKMPINFYGRVVDQSGKPIEGARVRLGWTDTSVSGNSELFVLSDENGEFSLTDETGKRLHIRVVKDGYHNGKASIQSFEYAAFFSALYYEPDPANPVEFVLIKQIEAEPLIAYTSNQQLPYDKGPYFYNFKTGLVTRKKGEAVGFKLIPYRDSKEKGKPFNWKLRIEAVQGQLQETNIEFPQIAPEEGYQPSWTVSGAASDKSFTSTSKSRFFFKSNDGHYAWVDILITNANWRIGGMRFNPTSFWNPRKDSRIVEVDKELQKPKRIHSDLK